MAGPRWRRKRRRRQTKELDDPCETAGPNRECSPVAPPSTNPNPLEEGRAPEGSDTLPSRRWAYAMCSVRCGVELLSLIWILLPDDLRNMLINTLSG